MLAGIGIAVKTIGTLCPQIRQEMFRVQITLEVYRQNDVKNHIKTAAWDGSGLGRSPGVCLTSDDELSWTAIQQPIHGHNLKEKQ